MNWHQERQHADLAHSMKLLVVHLLFRETTVAEYRQDFARLLEQYEALQRSPTVLFLDDFEESIEGESGLLA